MVRSLTSSLTVGLTLCACAAFATTVLYQDVPSLARHADAIVRGTVSKQQSRWTGDHRRIVTDVEIQVAESFKGFTAQTVVVRQPGGVVDDIGQHVDGFPSFKVGDEVVLFLERRPDDSFMVSGAAQGKYRIERSADGRGVFAVPDANVGDAEVVDPLTHQSVTVSPKTWALEDLRIEIVKAITGAGPTQPTQPTQPTVPPTTTTPGHKAPGAK